MITVDKIRELLAWDNERLAKAAKEGNVAALGFLIDAYKPLVHSVVWKHIVPLKIHRAQPDPYSLVEWLSEIS